jgi:hypothetical protein
MKYLAIKNWEKYQADKNGKVPDGAALWCKLYNSIFDDEFITWSPTEQLTYLLLLALRSRVGKNLPNDHQALTRMMGKSRPGEAPNTKLAITKLLARGAIYLTDQQNGALEESRVDKEESRVDEDTDNRAQAPSPAMKSKSQGDQMSSKSQIEEVCLEHGKDFPHGRDRAWTEIRRLEPRYHGIFGTVEEFKRFIQDNSDDDNPVSSFAKVKPPVDFVPVGLDDSALVKLLDDIAALTQQTVFFVGRGRSAASRCSRANRFENWNLSPVPATSF